MGEITNSLHTEHLHFLKEGVQFIEENEPSLIELSSKLPLDKLQVLCSEDFAWAFLYELPLKQHLILLFSALDLLPLIKHAIDAGTNANQAVIDLVMNIQKDPDTFFYKLLNIDVEPTNIEEIKKIKVGSTGCFSLSDLFVLMNAIFFQTKALRKYGRSLSELVEDVRHGKDESFWLALHIDPTILSSSVFARRMSIASIQNNHEFFRLLGNAVKVKWEKPKSELDPLRVILHACNEAGLLKDMSLNAADKLFIEELQVYSNNGEDPARGLQRFIDRWKDSK